MTFSLRIFCSDLIFQNIRCGLIHQDSQNVCSIKKKQPTTALFLSSLDSAYENIFKKNPKKTV